MQKLSSRKHCLLIGAVDEYIKFANPMTSGGAKEKFIKDISTATLRNELNALEEMGYLKQLHTSGGRVPTAMGYKYYVESLLKDVDVNNNDLQKAKLNIDQKSEQLADIVSNLAKIVSETTNYPTVIFADGFEKLTVENIKIIPLINQKALALVQTRGGYLNNTININADEESCKNASIYLSNMFTGQTIQFMLEHMQEAEEQCKLEINGFKNIIDNLIEGIKGIIQKPYIDVNSSGSAKLLENNDKAQTQKVLTFLEDKQMLSQAMQIEDNENGVIFEMVEEGDLEGCAIVKAPITVSGKTVATIGVVGPQRMNYANIASALKIVMNEVENLKNKGDNNGKKR